MQRSLKNLLAGAIFVAFGLAFAIAAANYDLGSALKMGPGYIPLVLGGVLVLLGAIIVAEGLLAGAIRADRRDSVARSDPADRRRRLLRCHGARPRAGTRAVRHRVHERLRQPPNWRGGGAPHGCRSDGALHPGLRRGTGSAAAACSAPGSASEPHGWSSSTNLGLGFATALSPVNVLYCFVGVLLGTLVGVLPGIGPTATIAMLLPITFTFEPVTALIMLAGIYYGAQYGGSTTAILINLPGEFVLRGDGHRRLPDGPAGAGRGGARHRRARLVLRRHGGDPHPGAVCAAARACRAEVRSRRVFLADRAGPRRLDRTRPWLDREGVGDDRARAAARHGRPGHLHRHAALHFRVPRALFAHQLRLRGGRHLRRRRDPAQPGGREDPRTWRSRASATSG